MTFAARCGAACGRIAVAVATSSRLLAERDTRTFLATVLVEIQDAIERRGATPEQVLDALVHVRWDGSIGPRLAALSSLAPLPDEKTPAERPAKKVWLWRR